MIDKIYKIINKDNEEFFFFFFIFHFYFFFFFIFLFLCNRFFLFNFYKYINAKDIIYSLC